MALRGRRDQGEDEAVIASSREGKQIWIDIRSCGPCAGGSGT